MTFLTFITPFPLKSLQTNSFASTSHPNFYPAVPYQPTNDAFDGAYTVIPHPSTSFPAGTSSAVFNSGQQASVFGIQDIPNPMTSAAAPSLTWTNPAFGSPTGGAPMPIVRPWGAMAGTSMDGATSARAEPRRRPVSRCSCCMRMYPLVRVDDTVEWVRPDVMKMVLYFNWSSNAEAEAHESWEP